MKFSHRITLLSSVWLVFILITVNLLAYCIFGNMKSADQPGSLENNLNILITLLFISTVGAIFFSVLGGTFIARIILKPISKIIETMEAIEGSPAYQKIPLPLQNKDEMYKLTVAFNKMVERIEDSFMKQEQFVSDASHELKTTLTIIESYANMLRRWGMSNAEVSKEAVETIYQEAIRMRKMTQQLLDLASANNASVSRSRLWNRHSTRRDSPCL